MKNIHQINVKPNVSNKCGLPKTSVDRVYISKSGLDGDYNNYRTTKKDKDPDMAVLLYPIETIQELNEEGWPIQPGDVGENLTISGISHAHFQSRQQYKIGDCRLEVSFECVPCRSLSVLHYVGDNKINDFIKSIMHRRGWYARVLSEGFVESGHTIKQIQWHIL